MSSFNQHECLGCGQPCDGLYCYPFTCQQCGFGLTNGICLNRTYGDDQPITCCECEGPLRGGFCLFCNSKAENSFINDPNLNSFNDFQNLSSPQPQYETYMCEICGNDSLYGYNFPPQFSLVYEQEPSCNQNFNENYYPHNSLSFLYCDNYKGPHATFQCQPMNQNFYNSSGFDQIQPPQYPVTSKEILQAKENLMKSIQTFLKKFNRISFREMPKNYSNAIAPVLPTKEPDNSLSIGDEHLSTILETESDEVIKSGVKNLVPSESKVTSDNESGYDVPVNDESSPIFTTFSNPLFDCNDDFTSSNDESLSNEDVPKDNFKIYSNPLFDDEEIISTKIYPYCFNAESNLIESLLNRDILIDSSLKFDYLLELAHIDPIPPRINEANFDLDDDYDSEGDIHFLEELLSNDTLLLPENESSNFDHHDDPSFPRPPPEPPDVKVLVDLEPDTLILTAKVVEDISKHRVLMPKVLPALCLNIDPLLLFSSKNEDKVFKPGILSYLLVSHQDKIISDFSESPIMMYRGDVPLLDVMFLHFYPP
nr:hypothetical protein [Tanacetum cinerariifolium]